MKPLAQMLFNDVNSLFVSALATLDCPPVGSDSLGGLPRMESGDIGTATTQFQSCDCHWKDIHFLLLSCILGTLRLPLFITLADLYSFQSLPSYR